MFIKSKIIIERQQTQIQGYEQEIRILRELLTAKNALIALQQNESHELKRTHKKDIEEKDQTIHELRLKNRQLEDYQSRLNGSVVSYE